MRRKRKRSLARIIWSWLLFTMVILLLVVGAVHLFNQRTVAADNSMYPVLCEGDEVFIDRLQYSIRSVHRFDVIAYPYRYGSEALDIKRVIGLPGETVQIKDGLIYINGYLLEEQYDSEPIAQAGMASTIITLNEDEYFVLCDNRSVSSDSREPTVGCIRRSEIVGRVILVLLPLQHFRLV